MTVPPGAPHTFANPGNDPLIMINTRYFKDRREMIEATGPLTPAATIEVMGRYATEPATDYA